MQTPMRELLECSFILLDKPVGPASHEVTSYVKRLVGARRTGHAGTLDPQVSGVLVVGLNRATRLIRFITAKDKEYVGVLRLKNAPRNLAELQAEMGKFVGDIRQMPPREAAVARRWRMRTVREFRALELAGNTALFVSKVEAGTYVRVLCTEVGKKFGGGKMLQLRRTKVGGIDEKRLVSLPDLADALWLWKEKGDDRLLRPMLVPAMELLELPILRLNEEGYAMVSRGGPLPISGVAKADARLLPGQNVLMVAPDAKLAGVGRIEEQKEGSPILARSLAVLTPLLKA